MIRIVFAVLGGWLGWKAGSAGGLLIAYFSSLLGLAAGLIIGRRITENLLE